MTDEEILNFFDGFKAKGRPLETKTQITNLYIRGFISKEEFLKRMKNAKD